MPAPSSVSQRPRGDRAHSAALAALWGQHPKVVEPSLRIPQIAQEGTAGPSG